MAVKRRLLRMREACHYLGVTRSTLINMEEQGLITPARTAGGHRRYSLQELEQFLADSRTAFERRPVLSRPEAELCLPYFVEKLTASPASTEEILAEAIEHLVELFQVEIGVILILDDEESRLCLQASCGLAKDMAEGFSIAINEGISGQALKAKQPLVYRQAESAIPLPYPSAQGVCVPLIYQNTAFGVLHIISSHRYQFFPSEINVLSTIATYLASLIVNSQLLVQYQRRLDELSLLNRISAAMQTKINLGEVLNTFLEEIIAVMDADAGIVFLYCQSEGELRVEAMQGFPEDMWRDRLEPGEGIAGWVVKHGRPYVSPAPDNADVPSAGKGETSKEIASRICVPLKTEDQIIGALYISTRTPHVFNESDVRFLSIVASQASVIIRRAQLYKEMAQPAKE